MTVEHLPWLYRPTNTIMPDKGPDSWFTPLTKANPLPLQGTAPVTAGHRTPSEACVASSSGPHSEFRLPPGSAEAESEASPGVFILYLTGGLEAPKGTEPPPTVFPTFPVALSQHVSNCGQDPLSWGPQTPTKLQRVNIFASAGHALSVKMTQLCHR